MNEWNRLINGRCLPQEDSRLEKTLFSFLDWDTQSS